MASTASPTRGGNTSQKKEGKQPHRRRLGLFVDITPLVDIAFLLLTFFMLSSTWNTPQVLEMSIPPSTAPSFVPASQLITVLVREDGLLTCTTEAEGDLVLPLSGLRGLLVNAQLQRNTPMVVAVDIAQHVAYGHVVDVLDELQLAERDERLVVVQQGANPALSTVLRPSVQLSH